MGLSNGLDLSIPSEPLMATIMIVYALNLLNKNTFDKQFLSHPITILILIQLIWMLFTSFTSIDILVSLKYFISRLWFIFSCYIIIPHLFINKKKCYHFVFCYASSLSIVVVYTILQHAKYNFNDKAADWVVSPFYNDHTAYGAALAMFIPLLLSFIFLKSIPKYYKIIAATFFFLFLLAIVLSYARAGWLSLVISASIFITLFLKIKFKTLCFTLITCCIFFFTFKTDLFLFLGQNTTDAEGGFSNNIESVSNISTDASNLERLNRWSCAFRMWQDKPFLGWGPGTYMFNYAPYQLSRDHTIISTNFGTNGNAHSEYLGPLSEQGFIGFLLVIILLLYATSLGYKLVYTLSDHDDKILTMGFFLGLMTYFVHGFFNNFLDTDKLSLPFWAFLAALVTFDLYSKKKQLSTN